MRAPRHQLVISSQQGATVIKQQERHRLVLVESILYTCSTSLHCPSMSNCTLAAATVLNVTASAQAAAPKDRGEKISAATSSC